MKISEKTFRENSEKSQPIDETEDDAETRNDFWSIEGDLASSRRTSISALRAKRRHVPSTTDISVDVTWATHTHEDVL